MNEIWALCFRKPGAGWRLVGRFLERDALVIFRIANKADIGIDYAPAATDVEQQWVARFGTQPPASGEWIGVGI